MNTRLQVEHPVTEMVTGLDLVEWQLRVAAGEVLPLAQEDVVLAGHAIEARIYAEDPATGFRPQTGRILRWRPQAVGARDGVRIDDGIAEGQVVTPFYDPMLAKVIAHGRDRAEAIARLDAALGDMPVMGVRTNRAFLRDVLNSAAFREGRMTTRLIDAWAAGAGPFSLAEKAEALDFALAAGALALAPGGDWFRSTGVAECPVELACGEDTLRSIVRFVRGRLEVEVDVAGEAVPFDTFAASLPEVSWSRPAGRRPARWRSSTAATCGSTATVVPASSANPTISPAASRPPIRHASSRRSPAWSARSPSRLAPRLPWGRPLVVIEAMKMETTLQAMIAGTVRALRATVGRQARAGDLLVEIEPR